MKTVQALLVFVAIVLWLGCGKRQSSNSYPMASVATEGEIATWPKTVEEAVLNILADMSDADKQFLRNTKKEKLISFHHGWGTGIRNEFGLWRGNTNLMRNCGVDHPDEASMVIIEAVWRKLQQP